MKATVPTPVSARPVQAEQLPAWANLEARPVLDQARKALNYTFRERVIIDTPGDGVALRVWESDPLPNDCTVVVTVNLAGVSLSGPAQACGYVIVGCFHSVAGTVSAVGTETLVFSQATEVASVPTYGIDAAERTVYLESADDGASPYRFAVVAEMSEAAPT